MLRNKAFWPDYNIVSAQHLKARALHKVPIGSSIPEPATLGEALEYIHKVALPLVPRVPEVSKPSNEATLAYAFHLGSPE